MKFKDFLHLVQFGVLSFFFISLFMAVFFWAFGPYMAACFEFTKDWTVEEIAILGDAIENPY